MEVVRIKKILAQNLLIFIGLHCVRRSSWTVTTLATLMEGFPPITLANDNYVKYSVMPEALESPEMIGNISKPESIKCMNSCKVQENNNQMSFAVYPQYTIFFHQKTFCHVAAHIWQNTCQNNNRAYFLNKKQPLLCSILRDYDDFFGHQILKNSNIVSIR